MDMTPDEWVDELWFDEMLKMRGLEEPTFEQWQNWKAYCAEKESTKCGNCTHFPILIGRPTKSQSTWIMDCCPQSVPHDFREWFLRWGFRTQ